MASAEKRGMAHSREIRASGVTEHTPTLNLGSSPPNSGLAESDLQSRIVPVCTGTGTGSGSTRDRKYCGAQVQQKSEKFPEKNSRSFSVKSGKILKESAKISGKKKSQRLNTKPNQVQQGSGEGSRKGCGKIIGVWCRGRSGSIGFLRRFWEVLV